MAICAGNQEDLEALESSSEISEALEESEVEEMIMMESKQKKKKIKVSLFLYSSNNAASSVGSVVCVGQGRLRW